MRVYTLQYACTSEVQCHVHGIHTILYHVKIRLTAGKYSIANSVTIFEIQNFAPGLLQKRKICENMRKHIGPGVAGNLFPSEFVPRELFLWVQPFSSREFVPHLHCRSSSLPADKLLSSYIAPTTSYSNTVPVQANPEMS